MSGLKLIIANKKYSSWSLRPWLALKVKNIPFDEELSLFNMSIMHEHFGEFSPTKKVPVLVHDEQTIWDSLAILEYLAELFPKKALWPADQKVRAHARCIANEMHAGFPALRTECPMNMSRVPGAIELSDEARVDIERVETIWADCIKQYGGPFLFGDFTISDAMFAPIVNRIEIYKLSDTPAVRGYSNTIRELPSW